MLRVPARLRAAAPYVVPALVFLAVLLAMFWRIWTPIDGARRAFGWDAQWEYWGDLQFQLDAYRAGELPLWNPFDRAGYPFHADPQAGVLYPVTWLLLLVGRLIDGVPYWLLAVKTILHFWIAALGVYAYLRRRGTPAAACYAGGFIFVFTYPYMHNSFSALNWSMAWAPWALLAVDAWAERPSFGRGAWVALALGMGYLAGAMASFWYTLLVVVPYGVWAIVHHARIAGDRRAYLRVAAASAAVAVGLFIAMIAAQFTATRALIPHTLRDVRDLEFIAGGAFQPDDLLSFLVPRFPGENCYIGFATALWVGAAVTIRPTARTLVLGAIATVGVLCAFGNVAPYLAFGASTVPPFGFFRRPHRYLYVTVLALALLGADGLTSLMKMEGEELRRRAARFVLIAGGLAVVVFGFGVVVKTTAPKNEDLYRDAYALAFVSAVVGAWVTRQVIAKEGRLRVVFFTIAAVITALDLATAQYKKLDVNLFPVPTTRRDADVRGLAGVPLDARVYDREVLRFRPGIRLQIRDLGGYEGDPLALSRYAGYRDAVKRRPALLAHGNVRWLLEGPTSRTKPDVLRKDGLVPFKGGIFEVPGAVPAVLWFDAARVVGGAGEALNELSAAPPGTLALVETGTIAGADAATLAEGARAPVPGRIVSFARNRIEVEIDAPDDGLVVVHEAYYPGWQVTVDGAEGTVLPANSLFRGVRVPTGAHRIVFRYAPPLYVPLAVLALAAMGGALFLALRAAARERRARLPPLGER